MACCVLGTDLPFPRRSGKVRDIYTLDERTLLIVATDRISAFDCVLPNGIPEKGALLTQLSNHWFAALPAAGPHHLIQTDVAGFPKSLEPWRGLLDRRSIIVRRTDVVPIECVVRGYLAGSGWAEYKQSGRVCGVRLPGGLRWCDRLPEPIFTPATKASGGHDLNITFDRAAQIVGPALARRLRERSLALYTQASAMAADRGILIADTKFEFGLVGDPAGEPLLIDEILTPDSSRFWPADCYQAGQDQPSFDKQYARTYLESLNWDKSPPAPPLPERVVAGTRQRYIEAYERLTGRSWHKPGAAPDKS